MDFWQGFLVITGVHLLAAASPGPDFVLVSQQTLTQGRKVGLWCSFGIMLGLGVHIIYSVLGLATIIANAQWLLTTIKILGGSYLLYLGYQGLKSKPKTQDTVSPVAPALPQKTWQIVQKGFLCNVFNPKAPVYFVAVFTLVLSPDMPLWQLALYGAWMMALQMAWFSAVVLLLSTAVIERKFQAMAHWIDRVLGAAMIGLGLNLLFRSR